jgi:DNA helicase HerA-like ATPase
MASTFLGTVGAVSGSAISVRLAESVASGIMIIGGRSYRVGQVGSFVRIPQGYHDLYGIISETGATANPTSEAEHDNYGERWMTAHLVGEIVEVAFERGISQYPNIKDEVHLVTESDLSRIYSSTSSGDVTIGRLANSESIPVRLDVEKLVTRHSAVLGSTGSGKSTSVASLLRSLCAPDGSGFNSARILLIDIHGEYASALSDIAQVFRALPAEGEQPLEIPYWVLPPSEIVRFLMGKVDDRQMTGIMDRIFAEKEASARSQALLGVDLNSMTADTPIPFSIHKLWLDLLDPEVKTWNDQARTTPAVVEAGDALNLKPPTYTAAGAGGAAPFLNNKGVLGIRRQLDKMRSRLLDRRYSFLFSPGDWTPDANGRPEKDLPDLLEHWIGHAKPITVLDLSGVPSTILVEMVGGILNIIYEALFWGRERSEGGRQRPQLVVLEEAHRYLGKNSENPARTIVQRIVKEGRKFGVGAMVVSQRPSEVDDTVLSQCGTFVSLRLTNSVDRNQVQAALPDSLAGIANSLPVLRTGEAIITGEAALLPVRCRLRLPGEGHRPNSQDPDVATRWRTERGVEDYASLAAAWRSQNPFWEPPETEDKE